MPVRAKALIAALACLSVTAGTVSAPLAAQARADWTRTINLLPNGAFVVGNPAAKSTLVEYFSYTCPHCRDFNKEGIPPILQGWVRSGTMKVEYRNWVRDPFDLVASILARCGGKEKFQANHEAIFANYDGWLEKIMPYARAHPEISDPENYTGEAFARTAEQTGLMAIIAKNGVTAAQQRACLADKQALATVLSLTAGSWDAVRATPGVREFPGTPTFLLDGKMVPNVASWDGLKPHLPPQPVAAK